MKIKIDKIPIKSGFPDFPETMTKTEYLLARLIYEDNEQPCGISNGAPNELIINEDTRKKLKPFLRMEGYSGHIPMHIWLRDNKPQFFQKHVTEADVNGIIIKLLIELQNFLMINNK